jgi:hypothetical protein
MRNTRPAAKQGQQRNTFSNLSLTGDGLSAVTASAISAPIRNADSFVRPGRSTNILSVSPYTTRAFHCAWLLMKLMAASSVALAVATMASANSANGIRPENPVALATALRTVHMMPGTCTVDQDADTAQRSCSIHCPGGHTCSRVAICHIRDELEGKLACIQAALQDSIPLCAFHGSFDHDPSFQNLLQQPGQYSLPNVWSSESNSIGRDHKVLDVLWHRSWSCVVPAATSIFCLCTAETLTHSTGTKLPRDGGSCQPSALVAG